MPQLKKLFFDLESGRLRSFWGGHLFQFGEQPLPAYDSKAGIRLLLIFLLLEGVVGPRLAFLQWLGIPVPVATIRVPILFLLSLVLVRFLAKIELSQIGLDSWTNWTATERWYFIQNLILVNVVFWILLANRLDMLWTHQALWGKAMNIFFVRLLWGFYQEIIYRGLLQTELVRRWGSLVGILVSNLLFTFGPLHFYHFQGVVENLAYFWMFGAIFAIGLFFGVLFKRSGNLWIVGVFHGIGDWYIDGLGQVVSLVQLPQFFLYTKLRPM